MISKSFSGSSRSLGLSSDRNRSSLVKGSLCIRFWLCCFIFSAIAVFSSGLSGTFYCAKVHIPVCRRSVPDLLQGFVLRMSGTCRYRYAAVMIGEVLHYHIQLRHISVRPCDRRFQIVCDKYPGDASYMSETAGERMEEVFHLLAWYGHRIAGIV